MKLPDQTKGPVKLTKIDYSPRLSEETIAFDAVIEINGLRGTVSNHGQGADNDIRPREVRDAVIAYCATLPPEKFPEAWGGGEHAVNYDSLISQMVGDAEEEHNDRKQAVKGFTTKITFGQRSLLVKGEPIDGDFKALKATREQCTIKSIAHLAVPAVPAPKAAPPKRPAGRAARV